MGINIIFEGVDRCGKSTTVQALVRELQREGYQNQVRKYKPPVTVEETWHTFRAYFNSLIDLASPDWLIWDRGHVSEMVYGPLYRGSNYTGSSGEYLSRWLQHWDRVAYGETYDGRQSVIVYLYPLDLSLLLPDTERGPEGVGVNAELAQFEVMLKQTRLPVIRVSSHYYDERLMKWQWKRSKAIVTSILEKVEEMTNNGTTH